MCEKCTLICEFCKKTFTNPGGKALHERWCRSNPNRNPIEGMKPPIRPSKLGGWECRSCHSIFRTKRELNTHLSDNQDCRIDKRKSGKDWTCKVCGLHFRVRSELFAHMNEANHKQPGGNHPNTQYTCQYCNKSWVTTKDGLTKHEKYCKLNPDRSVSVGHPHSDETKKIISEKIKEYLVNNPDKHPWRSKTKFISTPCEDLKDFLRSKGYSFEEEAIIIKDRNFSADICFKDISLVIEVNGFQHYIKDSLQLKPYYQSRHEIIESAGWKIIEVPCKESYTDKFRTYLCNIIDSRCSDESIIEKANSFYIKTHTELLLERRKRDLDKAENFEVAKEQGKVVNNRIVANKLSYEDIEHRKQLILNSSVDLTKFGWVSKVSAVTCLTNREIYLIVEKCDDLKSIVFRRK